MLTSLRLDVARVFLRDSQEALARHALRTALSRAYYASYHACVALFEQYGYRPQHFIGRVGRPASRWEHGLVIRRVLIELSERRQLISTESGWGIRRLYADRIIADDDVAASFEEVYVPESVRIAAGVVSEVQTAMRNNAE